MFELSDNQMDKLEEVITKAVTQAAKMNMNIPLEKERFVYKVMKQVKHIVEKVQ